MAKRKNLYTVYDLNDKEVCLGIFDTSELCDFLGKTRVNLMSGMRHYQEKHGTPLGTAIVAERYLIEKWSDDDGS